MKPRAPVNFCPAFGTVLANEEVENGKSKEGGYPVERRPLRQWILKNHRLCRPFAPRSRSSRLARSLKKLQINWIGRSEGAKIHFVETKTKDPITVFTTCPDTLFGATFLVLSPEHPLVAKITTPIQKAATQDYLARSCRKKRSGAHRSCQRKNRRILTGAYAINPLTGKEIPIWIADYVLMGYGTGAVMGVPAHDERDFEFAKHYKLPIKPVIEPKFTDDPEEIPEGMTQEQVFKEVMAGKHCWHYGGTMVHSDVINGLDSRRSKKSDDRLARETPQRRRDGQLQTARLAFFSPALLGRALPDPPFCRWHHTRPRARRTSAYAP